uniref:Uncharacterized protein n=1 Tax=Rhizophora mucronata TaxID=61149 RepID=A0A2P2ISH1_RHIMU
MFCFLAFFPVIGWQEHSRRICTQQLTSSSAQVYFCGSLYEEREF